MSGWRIRDYHADDVDGILRLWEQMLAVNAEPVYGLSDVLASCAKDHAVVAVIGDEVVGAAIGRAAHAQGWVVFLATAAHVRGSGIGSSMLAALEARMAAVGISKLSALMPAAETRVGAFLHQGFALKQDLHYFERHIPVQREELKILADLGGRVLPRGLWDGVGGMTAEKDLLERRVVMPLAQSNSPTGSASCRRARSCCSGRPERVRPLSRRRSRHAWSGRSSRCSRHVWHRTRAGSPVLCARRSRRSQNSSTRSCSSTRSRRSPRTAGRAALAHAGRHERAAEDHPRVPRARPAPDLRHELHQGTGCRVPASRPVRLRDPDRAARRSGATSDLGALHPRRRRRCGRRRARRHDRRVLARRHRVRRAEGVAVRAREAVNSGAENPEGPFVDDYVAAISATRATVSADVAAEFWEDIENVGRL